MKSLCSLLVVLCLLLSACSHVTPQGEGSGDSSTQPPAISVSPAKSTAASTSSAKSTEQAATEKNLSATGESSSEDAVPLTDLFLEDYDQLWQILEEDYPYWEYLKIKFPHLDEIRERFRERTARAKVVGEFYKVLTQFFQRLEFFGTLQPVQKDAYDVYYDLYVTGSPEYDLPEEVKAPFREVLTNPKVVEYYGTPKTDMSSTPDLKGPAPNVSYYDDCGALRIRLQSFVQSSVARDKDVLAKSLEQYPDTKHIIFDIRGNYGGSVLYWINNLVAPFGEDIQWTMRSYYRDTPLVRPFFAGMASHPVSELTEVPSWVQEFKLDRFFESSPFDIGSSIDTVPVSSRAKRWVLVDGGVFGTADTFAAFCKDSGWATLVGKDTRGGSGEAGPILTALHNTGIIFCFDGEAAEGPGGVSSAVHGTAPDCICENSNEILAYCLELIRSGR
ncbi:MAG: hypothetical protein J6H18_04885 [Lachnospiraceae bacterium]|nr:hypothetical protein [Lachnospiraceae bacterium]